MSTTLARLAAAVLSTEKGRKTVGWVIAARCRQDLCAKLFAGSG